MWKAVFLPLLVLLAGCVPEPCGKEFVLLAAPAGLALDHSGSLIVAEWGAGRVVRLSGAGDRLPLLEHVGRPAGVAVGADGTIFVSLQREGRVVALARGEPDPGWRTLAEGLSEPMGVAVDSHGGLLIAEKGAGRISRLTADGALRVLAEGLARPVAVLPVSWGGLLVAGYGEGLLHIPENGEPRRFVAKMRCPGLGLVEGKSGDIYAPEQAAGEIRRIERNGAVSVAARGLAGPTGLLAHPDGHLLVGIKGEGVIRRIPVGYW